jgi:hypothetical protein
LSLATSAAFSNCETAPSTCRISTAVGVVSRNESGLSAATSVTPRPCRKRQPVSWTIRSRANREAVSTMMTRTRCRRCFEHGGEAFPLVDRVSAADGGVVIAVVEVVAVGLGELRHRFALALLAVLSAPTLVAELVRK